MKRVLRQDVLDVHQQQLLVLLLVLQADLDHGRHAGNRSVGTALQQVGHRIVHMASIREDLVDRRPGTTSLDAAAGMAAPAIGSTS